MATAYTASHGRGTSQPDLERTYTMPGVRLDDGRTIMEFGRGAKEAYLDFTEEQRSYIRKAVAEIIPDAIRMGAEYTGYDMSLVEGIDISSPSRYMIGWYALTPARPIFGSRINVT